MTSDTLKGSSAVLANERRTVLHKTDIVYHFEGGQAEHSQFLDVHAKCVEESRVTEQDDAARALTAEVAAWAWSPWSQPTACCAATPTVRLETGEPPSLDQR